MCVKKDMLILTKPPALRPTHGNAMKVMEIKDTNGLSLTLNVSFSLKEIVKYVFDKMLISCCSI